METMANPKTSTSTAERDSEALPCAPAGEAVPVDKRAESSCDVASQAVETAVATEVRPPAQDDSQDPLQRLLWRSYRACPCDEHRNLLVEAYQGLVREIVPRFAARLPRNIDRGDLEIAANVGLMSSIKSFDPERGVRFPSYAERRIKGALLDELRKQDWLPRPWRQRIELHKRTVEELRSQRGREARDEEVADAMGMNLEDYQVVFGQALPGAPTGSMPNEGDDGEGPPSLDVVPDSRSIGPGEKLTRDELLRLVAQRLSEQEARIVYLKYWENLPMREIGELTGLSESRVSKIHARLLERLKDRFRVGLED